MVKSTDVESVNKLNPKHSRLIKITHTEPSKATISNITLLLNLHATPLFPFETQL